MPINLISSLSGGIFLSLIYYVIQEINIQCLLSTSTWKILEMYRVEQFNLLHEIHLTAWWKKKKQREEGVEKNTTACLCVCDCVLEEVTVGNLSLRGKFNKTNLTTLKDFKFPVERDGHRSCFQTCTATYYLDNTQKDLYVRMQTSKAVGPDIKKTTLLGLQYMQVPLMSREFTVSGHVDDMSIMRLMLLRCAVKKTKKKQQESRLLKLFVSTYIFFIFCLYVLSSPYPTFSLSICA